MSTLSAGHTHTFTRIAWAQAVVENDWVRRLSMPRSWLACNQRLRWDRQT